MFTKKAVSEKRAVSKNLWKFTPSEDGLTYKKVISEDQLDVDSDDECKYKK